MDLKKVQQEILNGADIDPKKVHPWVYDNQSIVFDLLFHDSFVGISYSSTGKSFNFILRNQSKSAQYPFFPKLAKYILEVYNAHRPAWNQDKTSLSFKYDGEGEEQIKQKFIEILDVVFLFAADEADFILNVEQDKNLDLESYLQNPDVQYIGIRTNGSAFFLSYAREHGLSRHVYALNRNGFIAVEHKLGISVFRRIKKQNYQELLPYFPESFSVLNNVFYTVEMPRAVEAEKKKLLIVFSYTHKSNENLTDRYYSHPYPFVGNSIMPNTYIVRVCDMADAFGSHGLNTQFDDTIEDNFQAFIASLMKMYHVEKEDVVLFGSSSGATAAAYHAITGGYRALAIDPYLGDETYYQGQDALYLKSLKLPVADAFDGLVQRYAGERLENPVVLCTSPGSDFYASVRRFKEELPQIGLIEVNSKKIKKHTDVAPNTAFLGYAVLNNLMFGVDVGDFSVDM